MTYSGDNLRVQKVDSAGTSKFIWDGQNVLMETDAANASNAVYTARPAGYGSMLSQRRKSGAVWTPSYYHFDQLGTGQQGTVAALTSSAQATTDTYKYRAFGEALATTGTTKNAFRYVGALQYYFDPDLAQYYVRRRVYLPTIARWLSADPLGFVDGMNRFVYVANGPTTGIDPTGALSVGPSHGIEFLSGTVVGNPCHDGKFETTWTWKFPRLFFGSRLMNYPDGYLVQRVTVFCSINACPCDLPDTTNIGLAAAMGWIQPCGEYFEAWHVVDGLGRAPGDVWANLDTFRLQLGGDQGCGWWFIQGEARYYPSYFEEVECDMQLLTPNGGEIKCCSFKIGSGDLLSSTNEPKIWNNRTPLGGYEASLFHSALYAWKCCDCDPEEWSAEFFPGP